MNDHMDQSSPDAARDWAARIEEPGFDDWDAHLAWLDEDPAHSRLYRTASLALSDGIASLRDVPPRSAANDDAVDVSPTNWRGRGGWLAAITAVAASLVAVLIPRGASVVPDLVYASAIGETRHVPLPDGTLLTLNGGALVRVSSGDPRKVTLEHGEVFVNVAHDANHPFTLLAADSVFEDVGTSFNARLDDAEVSLAVAEGVVAYDPDAAAIRMSAGQSVTVGRQKVVLKCISPSAVGSWRSGRLIYTRAAMSRVARDLSASLGVRIRLSDEVAARRFSGVIVLTGSNAEIMQRFAALSGISGRHEGNAWSMR